MTSPVNDKDPAYAEASAGGREMIVSRVINAPREKVWRAFSEPGHLIHWWGPNGFTNTFHEFSFTEGGVWRFMMHGPDGTDYPNRVIFEEITPQSRVVYKHDDDDDGASGHAFRSTVNFEEVEGGSKTKVTLNLVFETAEEREKSVKFGAVEGGNQTLGRWDAYAQTMR